MKSNNEVHAVCKDCLTRFDWAGKKQETSDACTKCLKSQPDIIYNQQGICTACYLKILNPIKMDLSGSVKASLKKSQSHSILISKKELMKNSFLSTKGKLLKKIEKVFTKYKDNDTQLIIYLTKKSLASGNISWEKMVSKVSKTSSVIYIFVGKSHILGAYHCESIALDEKDSMEDEQCGLFMTQRSSIDVQFYKVKRNKVTYNQKLKTIQFGYPSSFDIIFNKTVSMRSELRENCEWIHFFIYHP